MKFVVYRDDFYKVLVDKYGEKAVKKQRRSIGVDFGVVIDADDNTDYRVVSVDVVPAFTSGENYEIPDDNEKKWIKTNPKIHADKATAAHQAYSMEWKGLVRMIKYWNNNPKHGEKPIKPSFLLEVMALECIYGSWGGNYAYEIEAIFNTLADRVFESWPDPAELGPPISESMDSSRKERARTLLLEAARQARVAINYSNSGNNGNALKAWRELFGVKFPLS